MALGSVQESATDKAAGAADPEGAAEPDGAAEPEGAAETDGAADGTASAIGSSVDPLRLTTTQEAAPITTIAATAIPMMRCRRLRAWAICSRLACCRSYFSRANCFSRRLLVTRRVYSG